MYELQKRTAPKVKDSEVLNVSKWDSLSYQYKRRILIFMQEYKLESLPTSFDTLLNQKRKDTADCRLNHSRLNHHAGFLDTEQKSGQAENTELSETSEMSEMSEMSEKISEMSEMSEKISEKISEMSEKISDMN